MGLTERSAGALDAFFKGVMGASATPSRCTFPCRVLLLATGLRSSLDRSWDWLLMAESLSRGAPAE